MDPFLKILHLGALKKKKKGKKNQKSPFLFLPNLRAHPPDINPHPVCGGTGQAVCQVRLRDKFSTLFTESKLKSGNNKRGRKEETTREGGQSDLPSCF